LRPCTDEAATERLSEGPLRLRVTIDPYDVRWRGFASRARARLTTSVNGPLMLRDPRIRRHRCAADGARDSETYDLRPGFPIPHRTLCRNRDPPDRACRPSSIAV